MTRNNLDAKPFGNEVQITHGPDRAALHASLQEGIEVEFNLEGDKRPRKAVIWGITPHFSNRRYWTIRCQMSKDNTWWNGTYWMKNGKREGYLEPIHGNNPIRKI